MQLTILVCLLVLAEYLIITGLVGNARVKLRVEAPATAGHEQFERRFRVQQNTLEQLIVFLPAALACAYYVNDFAGAGIGLAFLVGRALYYRGYVTDPPRRTLGMLLTFFSNVALVLAALIGAVASLVRQT